MRERLKMYHQELCNISPNAIIGDDCIIHDFVSIYDDVIIGNNVKIQEGAFIPNGVNIGSNVFVGPKVIFTNDKYPPSNHKGWQKTMVGEGVSIGAGSIILPGLVLESGCIIGAGSVVTKNVLSGTTVVGNPAKELVKKEADESADIL